MPTTDPIPVPGLNRRAVLGLILAGVAVLALPSLGRAQSTAQAQALVQQISTDVTALVNSGRSEAQRPFDPAETGLRRKGGSGGAGSFANGGSS